MSVGLMADMTPVRMVMVTTLVAPIITALAIER